MLILQARKLKMREVTASADTQVSPGSLAGQQIPELMLSVVASSSPPEVGLLRVGLTATTVLCKAFKEGLTPRAELP